MKRFFFILALAGILVLLAGCTTQASQSTMASATGHQTVWMEKTNEPLSARAIDAIPICSDHVVCYIMTSVDGQAGMSCFYIAGNAELMRKYCSES
jgi:hypothetical protein